MQATSPIQPSEAGHLSSTASWPPLKYCQLDAGHQPGYLFNTASWMKATSLIKAAACRPPLQYTTSPIQLAEAGVLLYYYVCTHLTNRRNDLFPIEVIEEDPRYKVHYIGYSSVYVIVLEKRDNLACKIKIELLAPLDSPILQLLIGTWLAARSQPTCKLHPLL